MKILLAVHHFPPSFIGGAELRAYRTAAALQQRGHAVRVVCVEQTEAVVAGELTWRSRYGVCSPSHHYWARCAQASPPVKSVRQEIDELEAVYAAVVPAIRPDPVAG